MKIIMAGYCKTGTKSMAAALTVLGYKVYDIFEHFEYHGDDWMKIMRSNGTIEDLKRMYEEVDAGIDAPFFYYWEEFHQAFPDAKIVLTIRDEDSWYKSMRNQFDQGDKNKMLQLVLMITPTGRRLLKHAQAYISQVLAGHCNEAFQRIETNEMTMRIRYRQHNEYVMKHAPKDKLLVYRVKDGWEPLCEFLGKEIPDKPFPRKNVGGTMIDEAFKESPVMIRMKREMLISMCILTGVGVYGAYVTYKRFPWSICKTYFTNAFSHIFT